MSYFTFWVPSEGSGTWEYTYGYLGLDVLGGQTFVAFGAFTGTNGLTASVPTSLLDWESKVAEFEAKKRSNRVHCS